MDAGLAWRSADSFKTDHAHIQDRELSDVLRLLSPPTVSMVNFNLINSLGDMDAEADAMVATAIGEEAKQDSTKLVTGEDVQDLVPGNIIKGKIGSKAGDDFI